MAAALSRDHTLWFATVVMWMATASGQFAEDCPLGWDVFNGHCYLFVFYPALTYRLAATACQVDGAHLLSVNSEEENDYVSRWLTQHEMDRSSTWWTSGIGKEHELQWEGDGTASYLDQSNAWVGEDERQMATLRIVYKFTTETNTFLWGRQYPDSNSPYICEIRQEEAFRINQAQRDHTFGTDLSDVSLVPKGPRFTIEPQSVVVVGRTEIASLDCVASSIPPATYSWYKVTDDGLVTITTDLDARYTLTNGKFAFQRPVEDKDAGDYFCVAHNVFGTIRSHPVTVSFGYLGEFSNDPPGAVRAKLYQGTYIDCNAPRYNPEASFQWYKGPGAHFVRPSLNQYLFESNNGRLYFSETQLADAGMYHCVVSLTAPVGQRVATIQPPIVTSLGIELIIKGDMATNFGPIIHNDFPTVFPAPSLRSVDLTLECFAYGRLPMYYYWRRDNGPIPQKVSYTDNGRVMLIPDAQLEDSGNYTCRVERGSRAADEKTLSLVVEAVPFFVFPLRDQHVDVSSSFSIQCQAMGIPLPSYTWFKNGQPLTSTVGDVEVRGNVVTFTNANPRRHDGMYACAATNVYGTRLSSAQVRVLEFKPSFKKRPLASSQMATVGGNTTIICQPESAPSPKITWYRNNVNMGLTAGVDGRVMMLDNGNLLITQVQMSDQGEYTCTAENSKGSASSRGLLIVVTQTTITLPPADTEVLVNSSAFLSCQASVDRRHHDMVYVWSFNGYTINVDRDPSFQRSKRGGAQGLHVINAQFQHEGQYRCQAVTVDDKATAAGYLTVKGPPSEPAGIYVHNVDNDALLSWTAGDAHGSPVIFYIIEYKSDFFPVWRVKERELRVSDVEGAKDERKKKYLITDLSPGSSYSFRVRAVNAFGIGTASQPSVLVKIPDAPPEKAPDGIREGISTVGTLAFSWDPLNPEDLTGQDKGYKVYWRKKSERVLQNSLWESKTVAPDTELFVAFVGVENYFLPYEVKVAAFNSLGHGPNSSVAVIMSQQELPVATPMNVWGEEYNATAIMVYWDPIPNTREMMKGRLMGFQINFWWEPDPSFLSSVNIYCSDCEEGMLLGLTPNEDYWVNVQVFNSAGLGPKGEDYRISTVLNPPLLYPEYVSVYSMEGKSVYVTWRGVPIGLLEEPLMGYKLHWWPATENTLTANETVIAEKRTWGVIEGVKEGIVYALRVLGYNAGGDGKKSPTVYFTLEGQVVYNPQTTEILATGSCSRVCVWMLVISCLVHWFLFSQDTQSLL